MERFERRIAEWRVRQRILELDVERFFDRLDFWSRALAWVAITGGIIVIARMIWRLI